MPSLAIIGSGPAGWTAAIYAARANLAPVLFAGEQTGGQLMTTTEVENFPGFAEGIAGPALMAAMQAQAERFGTVVKAGCVVRSLRRQADGLELAWDDLYSLDGSGGQQRFDAVIVATGASARYLGLPGEAEFLDGSGRKQGLSGCAVCDGAMPMYRDQPLAVVGGGDSACEEALFLTKYASRVHLIHRRDALRASAIMAQRVLEHPSIEMVWNSTLSAYHTDDQGRMQAVTLRDTVTGAERDLAVRGVFMGIGHQPNTAFLKDSGVPLDEAGYLQVSDGCRTAVPGLFAAGDVRDSVYRQAITAAGMGCMAALEAGRYLDEL